MKRLNPAIRMISSAALAVALSACTEGTGSSMGGAAQPAHDGAEPARTAAAAAPPASAIEAQEQKNLATFDYLDYNVFSNAKWDELSHSHAKDVIVHWPDGHITKGIDVHIEDLKKMFVYAPDTRIKHHEHKIAQGNFSAVSGAMEGTFTKPMPTADGQEIQPTGKAFKLPMATIGRWENGVMQEEWLFWDNQTYMTQLGLAK